MDHSFRQHVNANAVSSRHTLERIVMGGAGRLFLCIAPAMYLLRSPRL